MAGPTSNQNQAIETTVPKLLGRPLNNVEKQLAPKSLFYRGNPHLLRFPKVSLVGSRQASTEGLSIARELSRALVSEHVVIVSGLAEGIDTAAHLGAIDAGGKTIAVLGTPLSESYPKSNALLQNRIAAEHLLLSQFPEGTPIMRHNFPQRNRTMALLADATVIIEASEKSGTRNQAWETLKLNRPLFVMNSLLGRGIEWIEKVFEYGAEPLSLDSPDLLFEMIPSYRSEEAREIGHSL